MTNQHPITPPPELVQQWTTKYVETARSFTDIANEVSQWGADQELEACCKWLECNYNYPQANPLRVARRPKPPSLKEQALIALWQVGSCEGIDNDTFETLRRALEALPND